MGQNNLADGSVKMQRRLSETRSETGGQAAAVGKLYRMQFSDLVAFVAGQPPSFWFVLLYLFFEYVRPQSIYSSIAGLPFAQAAMALALVALLLEGKIVRRFNRIDGAMLVFGIVVLASIGTAYDSSYSLANIKVVANWFLIYYLITNLVDTERRFLVLMLSFLLWSLKMSQHATRSWLGAGFGFRGWGATGAPGWFHNSGEFAVQMTIFVPLAVYFILALRKYWVGWKTWLMWLLPASGIVGVLASQSRGGQLGMAAVIVVMAAKSRRKARAFGAIVLVAVTTWILMPEAQRARFQNAGEDQTSEARLAYWEDGVEIMNEHPVLGIGYDNWLPYYRTYYRSGGADARWLQNQLPHNIFVEAGAELGYMGLLGFLLMIGATLYLNHRTRRIAAGCRGDPDFFRYMAHGLDAALVGYLVSGFFVTVLYYPYFWINLAMTSALYSVAADQVRSRTLTLPERLTTELQEAARRSKRLRRVAGNQENR